MNPFDGRVRHAIYQQFAATTRAPTVAELAQMLATGPDDVRRALDTLAEGHLLALDPGTHDIWMAHPFAARDAGYAVTTGEGTYQANCAWDALALPSLLGRNAMIRCRCADCEETLEIPVTGGAVQSDLLVHFVVPPPRFWDDIGFT